MLLMGKSTISMAMFNSYGSFPIAKMFHWLVVFRHPSEKNWLRQLGDFFQYMGK